MILLHRLVFEHVNSTRKQCKWNKKHAQKFDVRCDVAQELKKLVFNLRYTLWGFNNVEHFYSILAETFPFKKMLKVLAVTIAWPIYWINRVGK